MVKEGVGHAVREAVNSPNVQKVLGTLGADLLGTSPTEFAEQVKQGSERIQELVQKYPLQ
jgi:tripartite-type tricarboxylate transporter receptor subunit TctC